MILSRHMWIFVAVALAGTARADPVLLASINRARGLGLNVPIEDERIAFSVQLSPALPLDFHDGIGDSVFWGDNANGLIDFAADNEDDFHAFASLATNGVDDTISWFANIAGLGGGGAGTFESDWLQAGRLVPGIGPDLFGYDLEFVRLVVNDVNFERIEITPGFYTDVSFDISYQFFGKPISEPTTGLLAILGLGLPLIARVLAGSLPDGHRMT